MHCRTNLVAWHILSGTTLCSHTGQIPSFNAILQKIEVYFSHRSPKKAAKPVTRKYSKNIKNRTTFTFIKFWNKFILQSACPNERWAFWTHSLPTYLGEYARKHRNSSNIIKNRHSAHAKLPQPLHWYCPVNLPNMLNQRVQSQSTSSRLQCLNRLIHRDFLSFTWQEIIAGPGPNIYHFLATSSGCFFFFFEVNSSQPGALFSAT